MLSLKNSEGDQRIELVRNPNGTAKVCGGREEWHCVLRQGEEYMAFELADVLRLKRLLDEAAKALYDHGRKP